MMFSVENLTVAYGEALALRDVHITVEAGSIVTIIGANGAGKTTLVNTIAGMLTPRAGRILLHGQDLSRVKPHQVCNHGIAIVPEGRRLLARLTVYDNLRIGSYPRHARSETKATLERVYGIFPRLAERKNQLAGTLSGGEQQMLAIGRALMARPRLLLLDEPSLGLAPIIVSSIFDVIKQINKEEAVTILLVEQNANMALETASKAYILSDGQIVREGLPQELLADNSVQQAYLGL